MHPKHSTWFLALSVYLRLDPTYPLVHRHKKFYFVLFLALDQDVIKSTSYARRRLSKLANTKNIAIVARRVTMTCTEFENLCKLCVFEILDAVD